MARPAPLLRLVRPDAEPQQRPQPQPQLDDTEILAALRAGDATAATALYDRAEPVVARVLGRLLGNSDRDFEDVAQRAMIELVRSLARYRGECSLDTWISRVTAHTAFKQLRRRKLERGVFAGDEELERRADPRDLEGDVMRRSGLSRVRAHLAALDPDKAWTLMLHDVCGHDLREIAEITGASVAAAQSRLVRGRRELQARLQDDPELADWLAGGVR